MNNLIEDFSKVQTSKLELDNSVIPQQIVTVCCRYLREARKSDELFTLACTQIDASVQAGYAIPPRVVYPAFI